MPYVWLPRRRKGSDIWKFTLIDGDHNHPPTHASAHPTVRKLHRDDNFHSRIRVQKTAGMLAKHGFDLQQQEDSGNPLIMGDYYNEQGNIRRQELQGRPPIHALLDTLTADNDDEWWMRYQTEFGTEGGPLTHLFFSHGQHKELLVHNYEVLVLDSTYKTNRFKLPLVNIVGITLINRLFFAGRFVKSEKVEDYVYVFESIKELYDVKKLPYPHTFITDGR
jgi:hypothetical protein